MKKLMAVFLSLAMACGIGFAFAGCSGGNVEEGATVITMYLQDFEDWNNEYMEDTAEEFNSIMDDGIQLEVRFFTDDAYTDALKVARENGTAPDIFMTSYGNLYSDTIATGYAAPLNDLLDQTYFDDIVDDVKALVSYEGNYYAYPQLLEPSALLFYRKDYFEEAGLDPDSPPKSWEELFTACEALEGVIGRGQYVLGMPIGTALGWATYGMQYNTTGGVALNDAWTEVLVEDNDEWRALLGFFYDVYAEGYAPAGNVSASGYNDIIDALCQDKLAMTIAGSWSIAEIVDTYSDMIDDIGVAVLPTRSGDQTGTTATNGGWTFSVSSSVDEEHQQKAARVLEYFFCESTERTAGYFEAASYSKVSPQKSVRAYLEENADDSLADWLDVVNTVSAAAKFEPTYEWDISTAVSTMFEYMAINSRPDKANREQIITEQISKCISTIETIMARPDFQPNPRYEEPESTIE